ncbi:MAG: isopentenyl-diphosphate Delta-isomerase [Flavobacteriales bacterium]
MKRDKVLLVDASDRLLGEMDKWQAHRKGVLHRAFSVFISNDRDQLLLQQRAAGKYHSPLLWTNAACSHQQQGESNIEAGARRLHFEMGLRVRLTEAFHFIYKASLDRGLTEHEFDYVLVGKTNRDPVINTDEVNRFRWVSLPDVRAELAEKPQRFTPWFQLIFERFYRYATAE